MCIRDSVPSVHNEAGVLQNVHAAKGACMRTTGRIERDGGGTLLREYRCNRASGRKRRGSISSDVGRLYVVAEEYGVFENMETATATLMCSAMLPHNFRHDGTDVDAWEKKVRRGTET